MAAILNFRIFVSLFVYVNLYHLTKWQADKGKVCLGCISETISCRKLMFGRDIGWGCRCATSWCDLELTLTVLY